jgi:hypothetical protein
MQKLILSFIVGIIVFPMAYGQQFSKAFSSNAGKKKVEIHAENVDLEIEGYNGNEVVIETTRDYAGPPERAEGLRPLFSNGATDNTNIGLEVKESNNVMTIRKATHEDMHYRMRIPAAASLSITEVGWMNGDIKASGLQGEIEIKGTGSDILLENITGPVVANTTSGDIEIVFSEVNQSQPTSISNTSGFIDITLPATTKATLNMSSISGEIYTDMDIKVGDTESGLRRLGGGRKIHGTLNGGGVEVSLRAISDDIYLRKK